MVFWGLRLGLNRCGIFIHQSDSIQFQLNDNIEKAVVEKKLSIAFLVNSKGGMNAVIGVGALHIRLRICCGPKGKGGRAKQDLGGCWPVNSDCR